MAAPSTVGEWDALIARSATADLDKWRKALSDLREWPEFKEAFGWTRMFLLIQEIDAEQRRRDQMSGCLFD